MWYDDDAVDDDDDDDELTDDDYAALGFDDADDFDGKRCVCVGERALWSC